jgi:hypothetical protein
LKKGNPFENTLSFVSYALLSLLHPSSGEQNQRDTTPKISKQLPPDANQCY